MFVARDVFGGVVWRAAGVVCLCGVVRVLDWVGGYLF
jgi:hypothetical protein